MVWKLGICLDGWVSVFEFFLESSVNEEIIDYGVLLIPVASTCGCFAYNRLPLVFKALYIFFATFMIVINVQITEYKYWMLLESLIDLFQNLRKLLFFSSYIVRI
jgi:hypothetical protein